MRQSLEVLALTQTCFVSFITLYKIGFDSLKNMPSDIFKDLEIARAREIKYIMSKQFVLSYAAHLSKADTDNMTPYELDIWLDMVKEQNALEKESIKQ